MEKLSGQEIGSIYMCTEWSDMFPCIRDNCGIALSLVKLHSREQILFVVTSTVTINAGIHPQFFLFGKGFQYLNADIYTLSTAIVASLQSYEWTLMPITRGHRYK